jgi:hypothetical protein
VSGAADAIRLARRADDRAVRAESVIGQRTRQVIVETRSIGAGNEARTRDLNLGKVALYQLSYSRLKQTRNCRDVPLGVKENSAQYAAKALIGGYFFDARPPPPEG